MKKNLNTRTIVIVATILICAVGIIGIPKSMADLKKNFRDNIRLGLDLRGGSHLVMLVKVNEAIAGAASEVMDHLKEDMKKAPIPWTEMTVNEVQRVEDSGDVALIVKGVPATQSSAFRSLVSDHYSAYTLTELNSTDYSIKLKPTDLIALERETVQRTIDTISNRIDALGLAEKTVTQYGRSGADFQVLVQLPGEYVPAHVKQLIGTAAKLEIVGVKDGPFASKDEALAKHSGMLPLNTRLIKMKPRGDAGGDRWYLVDRRAVVSGSELRNAHAGQGEMGKRFLTTFSMSPEAGSRFGRYTEQNIGNNLAVVLDDQIVSVAEIKMRIEDSGQIEGLGSEEEAMDLSRYLKSGSFPAGVEFLEEDSIGPSLGADSISEGMHAGIYGLVAVVAVMLIYYRRSGVNAVLALILNTIILLAAVSYFHAVLTLPGIAGVILTIGMAVDSNVLIFERIREELRAGKSVVAAVDTGFNKAWWTIVDTHVTTVVSCAFLFLFGEGPVKGFAVTLTIGLIANVFTAVFVSRTIFDFELSGRRQLETLSI